MTVEPEKFSLSKCDWDLLFGVLQVNWGYFGWCNLGVYPEGDSVVKGVLQRGFSVQVKDFDVILVRIFM